MNRLLAIGIVLACFPCYASGRQHVKAAPTHFGRSWWVDLSDQNASGFVDGYADCLPPRRKGKQPGWNVTSKAMAEEITDYYARHPQSQLLAGRVLLKVAATTKGMPPSPGGEVYTNRHGYYDGLWWTQSRDNEQLGYVEGYLFCLGRLTSMSQAKRLADAVGAWYAAHSSREDRAIAYVLAEQMKQEKPAQ